MPTHQDKPFDATKFVNRTVERASFEALTKANCSPCLPVLCFYGVGGVGKSFLNEAFLHFLSEYNQRNSDNMIRFAAINFKAGRPVAESQFYFNLATVLIEKDVSCPRFQAVWHSYTKTTEAKNLKLEDFAEPESHFGNFLKATVPSLCSGLLYAAYIEIFNKNSEDLMKHLVAGGAVTLATFLSVALFISKNGAGLIYLLVDHGLKALIRFAEERFDYRFRYRNEEDASKLVAAMPGALIEDLEKGQRSTQGRPCASVIFFDTVEDTLRTTDTSVPQESLEYEWIARFAELSKHSLVVVSGHNAVEWQEYSPAPSRNRNQRDWAKEKHFKDETQPPPWTVSTHTNWGNPHLIQYRLLDLKKGNAEELLTSYGISDQALRAVILSECLEAPADGEQHRDAIDRHHAQSLDICIQTVKNDIENNRPVNAQTFELKEGGHADIYQRYLKSLSREEWDMTTGLALTPQFDLKAARARCDVKNTLNLNPILNRNYVTRRTQGEAGEWFSLSRNMRRHILAATKARRKRGSVWDETEEHQRWREYWQDRQDQEQGWAKDPLHLYSRLAWYHHWQIEPEKAWEQWQRLFEKVLQDKVAGNAQLLLAWWDMTEIKYRKPQSELEADVVLELACDYWGIWNQGLQCCERALEFFERDTHAEMWAYAQHTKGLYLTEIGKLSNLEESERLSHLQEALDCYRRALVILTKDDYPKDWADTQYNQGTTHAEIGELSILDENERLGHLQEALNCYKRALEIRTKNDHPKKWADAEVYQGIAHYEIGKLSNLEENERLGHLQEALDCYKRALEIRTKNDHPKKWADTEHNKALTEWRLEDFGAALISMEYAVEGYRQIGNRREMEKAQRLCDSIRSETPIA